MFFFTQETRVGTLKIQKLVFYLEFIAFSHTDVACSRVLLVGLRFKIICIYLEI